MGICQESQNEPLVNWGNNCCCYWYRLVDRREAQVCCCCFASGSASQYWWRRLLALIRSKNEANRVDIEGDMNAFGLAK